MIYYFNKDTKQHHTIEIFSANCALCSELINTVQIGKCQGCRQVVYDVNKMSDNVKTKMKDYEIKAVPTTIIDGKIKVVGVPDFPWICGDDLYRKLEREYPLNKK